MTPGHTPALPLLKSLKSTSGWQEEAGAAWECSQHGISGVLLTAALPEVLDLLLTPSTAVFTLLKEDAAFPPFPEARSWALWSRQMDVPHPQPWCSSITAVWLPYKSPIEQIFLSFPIPDLLQADSPTCPPLLASFPRCKENKLSCQARQEGKVILTGVLS